MKKTLHTALVFLLLYGASVPVQANWVFVDPDTKRPPMLGRGDLWPQAGHTMPGDTHPIAHPNHTAAEIDLVFDYLERGYSKYLPSHQRSYYSKGFRVRYYPTNDSYIYVKDDKVYFENTISNFQGMTIDVWLGHAKDAGMTPPTNPDIPNTSHPSHPAHQVEQVEALFDWFEDTYPEYFPTDRWNVKSYYSDHLRDGPADGRGYRFRYYESELLYLYVRNGQVKFSNDLEALGDFSIQYWLNFSGISAKEEEPKIDLLFDWMEENYSYYFTSHQESYYKAGNWTRHYPLSNSFLYVKDGNVHFSHHGGHEVLETFSVEFWNELSGTVTAIAVRSPEQEGTRIPGTDRVTTLEEKDSQIDLVFDWIESKYIYYFSEHQESYNDGNSRLRYYPDKWTYMTFTDGEVYFSKHFHFLGPASFAFWREFSGAIAQEVPRTKAERKESDTEEAKRRMVIDSEAEQKRIADLEAARIEADKAQSEADAEAEEEARTQARMEARVQAALIEAARIEAERVEAERVEAERVEAERIEAEKVAQHAPYTVEQIELLLNWMEDNYPDQIPTHQESYYAGPYITRHYPSNNGYLFVKDSRIYFLSDNLKKVSFSLSYLFQFSGITTKD